ncbi:MAG: DUF3267 domain-containing protein [Chloroflexota bacterium]|nr:DUF3267 domain-containing protein [Chloroflexota bacterium]MDE2839563.1 DUF3267 domain-containing protein [Chloroflexota bacterium]MDE2929493.1 DUF3267 domain-containing protein [Chloroflexota bacterium]
MAKNLPQGYAEIGRWEIAQAPKWFWVVMAAFSLAALLVTWLIVPIVLAFVHGSEWGVSSQGGELVLSLSLGSVLTVVLHELFHGIGFRACGARPRFGFKPWTKLGPVFYTSAPGYYLRRGEYLAAGLAPVTLLTVALFVALALIPVNSVFSFTAYLMAGLNVAGSVGDIFLVRKVLTYPPESYYEDREDGFVVYGSAPEAET